MKRITLFAAMLAAMMCFSCKNGSKQSEAPKGEASAEAVEETKADSNAAKPAPESKPEAIQEETPEGEEALYDIVTSMGTIRIKLYDDTPLHKANFEALVEEKFYDGILFHRVIDGFMIQTGDPLTKDPEKMGEWGTGGPGYTIPAEIVPEHTHKKGAVAAARRGDEANPYRESSGSQFYIVQDPEHCRHLDGAYTIFGETVSGLDVVDRIAHVQTLRNDRPVTDVKITKIVPVYTKE